MSPLTGLAAVGAAIALGRLGSDDFQHLTDMDAAIVGVIGRFRDIRKGRCASRLKELSRAQGSLGAAMAHQRAIQDTGMRTAAETRIEKVKKRFKKEREAFITSGCVALSR